MSVDMKTLTIDNVQFTMSDPRIDTANTWTDVTSSAFTANSQIISRNGLKVYYNAFLGLVHISGDLTVTLSSGSNILGTISSDYRPKVYYTPLTIMWDDNQFNAWIMNRTSMRAYTTNAYEGYIALSCTYPIY